MKRRLYNENWFEMWTCGACGVQLELPFDGYVTERGHNCEPVVTIRGIESAAMTYGIMRCGPAYEKELTE